MELKQGSYREVARPDPQVPEKPLRRWFTANYQLQVLQQADTCSKFGDIGRLLRREGLYSSHLTRWHHQRDKGVLDALGSKTRGRKAAKRNLLLPELERLEKEKKKLRGALSRRNLLSRSKKLSQISGGHPGNSRERRERLMEAVEHLTLKLGTKTACEAFRVSRTSLYPQRATQAAQEFQSRPLARLYRVFFTT